MWYVKVRLKGQTIGHWWTFQRMGWKEPAREASPATVSGKWLLYCKLEKGLAGMVVSRVYWKPTGIPHLQGVGANEHKATGYSA